MSSEAFQTLYDLTVKNGLAIGRNRDPEEKPLDGIATVIFAGKSAWAQERGIRDTVVDCVIGLTEDEWSRIKYVMHARIKAFVSNGPPSSHDRFGWITDLDNLRVFQH